MQPALKERLIKQEGKWIFKITDRVFLSQKDIRQVHLAKGAIRAGIEFLLESRGGKAQAVDKVLIAGSFGYHLRAKSLINIGLLPRSLTEKIAENVEVLELANITSFERAFVSCLEF